MSRKIFLIRHAQSIGNRDNIIQGHYDTPLTELGESQAENTAIWFEKNKKELNIQSIYSSDLTRTRQTAQPICEKLGLELITKEEIREAFFGKWEGKKEEDIEREDPHTYNSWKDSKSWVPEWCETFAEQKQRAITSVKEIVNQTNGNIIIVSHGGFIYAFLSVINPEHKDLILNCTVNTILVENSLFKIEEINFLAPNVEKIEKVRC